MSVKSWIESKTIRFFALVGIVSAAFVAENLTEEDLGTGLSTDLEASIAVIVLAVAGILLRFITNTGVTKPTDPPTEIG